MKRLLKHIFQTALLVALAWIAILLPNDTWATYLNPVIWGIIAFILIAVGIYLYREHKKGLFVLVGLTVLCLSHQTFAYQTVTCTNETGIGGDCSGQTGCSYHTCMVDAYKDKSNYCSLKNSFNITEAVKDESKAPKADDIKNARTFMDALERSVVGGCTSSISASGHKDKYDCAKEYLKKVASYKTLKSEPDTKTVYQLLKADKGSCWPCGMINIMMVAVEKLALSMEDELSKAALYLLGIMFLFWLLFKVLMLISQFGTANNAEFFTDLLTRVILAVMAVGLLNGPMGFVYRITFSSLLDVTLTLSSQVVATANSTSSISMDSLSSSLSAINGVQGLGSKLVNNQNLDCGCCTSENSDCNGGQISECRVNYTGSTSYAGTGFSDDEVKMLFSKKDKQALMCLTCKAYKETTPFVAAGRVLVYHAWKNKKLLSKIIEFFEKIVGVQAVSWIPSPISMWFVGMALIVCFTWISYVVGFKLLDVFLRIGFIIILTPLLITAFVFPISRQYTKRGWDFLVHALLSIFAVSIGIALFMAALTASLPTSMVNTLKNLFTMTEVADKQKYAVDLMDAICGGNDGSAFYTFFMILLLCFCGIKVLQASQVIIEGLSGLTCGIPAISGVAVVGAIRAALAPLRMAKNIIMDKLNPTGAWGRAKAHDEKEQERSEDPDNYQPDFVKKTGDLTGSGTSGGSSSGRAKRAADRVANAAGRATENAARARGEATENAGKAGAKAFGETFKASVKGAVKTFGASLIIAIPAGIMWVASKGVQYAGWLDKKTAKAQGTVVKEMVKAGARIRLAFKHAQRIWRRARKKIANRIKQLPATIKNLPKKIKGRFSKEGRRARAREKYGRHRESDSGRSSSDDRRSDRKSEEKPDRKSEEKDEEKNDKKPEERERRTPEEERAAKRRWLRAKIALDSAEDRIDESLDAVENSFGNGGNQVLPDTNSEKPEGDSEG